MAACAPFPLSGTADGLSMEQQVLALMADHRVRGYQPGSQLVVTHRGQRIFDLADGEARPGQPMTGAHVLRWYEAAMPLLAVRVGQLLEKDRLDLDDLVSDYIEGWGAGKETCTVRHLLTHLGGFAGAELGDRELDHQQSVELIAAYRAESAPGHRASFHPTSGWRILGELVRLRGRGSLAKQLHRFVMRPADMVGASLGISPGAAQRLGDLLGPTHWSGWEASEIVDGEPVKVPHRADLIHNLEWHRSKDEPALGCFGTARDLAVFYDTMADPAHPFFEHSLTASTLTSVHRDGLRDHGYGGAALPWGLGFQLAGCFGGSIGYRTFGHTGRTGRAIHDPVEGLTVVYITNGLCRPIDNERRCTEMTELVQELLCPRPAGGWVTQGLATVSAR